MEVDSNVPTTLLKSETVIMLGNSEISEQRVDALKDVNIFIALEPPRRENQVTMFPTTTNRTQ